MHSLMQQAKLLLRHEMVRAHLAYGTKQLFLTQLPVTIGCAPLIKESFSALERLSASEDGLAKFSKAFKLCQPLKDRNQAYATIAWATSALSVRVI